MEMKNAGSDEKQASIAKTNSDKVVEILVHIDPYRDTITDVEYVTQNQSTRKKKTHKACKTVPVDYLKGTTIKSLCEPFCIFTVHENPCYKSVCHNGTCRLVEVPCP